VGELALRIRYVKKCAREICENEVKRDRNKYCSRSCQVSDRNTQCWRDSEYRAKMSAHIVEMWKDPDYREIRSEQCSELNRHLWDYSDPTYAESRSKHSASMIASGHTRERNLENWKNPEYREKMEAVLVREMAIVRADPEFRAKKSAELKNLWADEEWRATKINQLSEKASARNSDPNDIFGTGRGKIQEYNGVIYKSSYEVELASFFVDNNIPFAYEIITIKMDNGHRYICDFALPLINMFVEVKSLKGPYGYLENYDSVIYKTSQLQKRFVSSTVVIIHDGNWETVTHLIRLKHEALHQ